MASPRTCPCCSGSCRRQSPPISLRSFPRHIAPAPRRLPPLPPPPRRPLCRAAQAIGDSGAAAWHILLAQQAPSSPAAEAEEQQEQQDNQQVISPPISTASLALFRTSPDLPLCRRTRSPPGCPPPRRRARASCTGGRGRRCSGFTRRCRRSRRPPRSPPPSPRRDECPSRRRAGAATASVRDRPSSMSARCASTEHWRTS
jgi:hypothetical protein